MLAPLCHCLTLSCSQHDEDMNTAQLKSSPHRTDCCLLKTLLWVAEGGGESFLHAHGEGGVPSCSHLCSTTCRLRAQHVLLCQKPAK